MTRTMVLAAVTALTVTECAQESRPAAGSLMDEQRLAQIRLAMTELVEAGKLRGAVTFVARREVTVLHEAFGHVDANRTTPMGTDRIFQIRSMTKMLTAVAVMMVVEAGGLSLSDPVEKYLPEFRGQSVLAARRGDQTSRLSSTPRPITVRDLLIHTSGMRPDYSTEPEGPAPPWGPGQQAMQTLASVVAFQARRPLEFEPGVRFGYSGAGFETLGRIVEVVSGQLYERFVTERIFTPLGMTDSFFFPPEEKRARVGPTPLYPAGARLASPANGASSTARDVGSFLQMIANAGALGGRRLLSPSSVRQMTSAQTGSLEAGWEPGGAWGLGFELQPSSGTLGHPTAGGSYAWVDPSRQLVGVFLGGNAEARAAFMAMIANAAID